MFAANLMVLLIAVPMVSYVLTRRCIPKRIYLITGIAFGAIVSPWAAGLYSLYFLSPWGLVPGLVGLALTLVHGAPGFHLAAQFGLTTPGVVSEFRDELIIELLNGMVWATIYGFLGLIADKIRLKRAQRLSLPI